MALKFDYNFKSHGINWSSGYIYRFRYNAYRHDPTPTIILMSRTTGIHPNTGHQHRYISGINFTYIPRSHRRLFAMQWKNTMEMSNGNVQFTWNDVKRRYPYLRFGIRRYVLKPVYRIQEPIQVPFDDMEDAIVDTFSKDFSKKVQVDLANKFNRIQKNIKKTNKRTLGGIFGRMFGQRRR